MTHHPTDWATDRQHIIRLFAGELPSPKHEDQTIDAYTRAPTAVLRLADEIATELQTGAVTSGWAILAYRSQQAAAPARNVDADPEHERVRAIQRAQRWLKNTGIHYDRATEIQAELFDRGGILEPWKDDQRLLQRMLEEWTDLRPIGEAIEQQDREDDERFRESHTCDRCGKLVPFKLQGCPHCAHKARIADLTGQALSEPDQVAGNSAQDVQTSSDSGSANAAPADIWITA